MYNIVEQIENRYKTEFANEKIQQLYDSIPRKLRQDVLIRKLNCKPYGFRSSLIRWGSPDAKNVCFVSMGNISDDAVELTVFPTPEPNSPDAAWYTEEGVRQVVTDAAVLKKLVFYKKSDGSRLRLRFKHLSWAEATAIIPALVLWSRKNQNQTKAADPKRAHTNTVGLKEYEMIALVLKTLGGKADTQTICQKYADLFGFSLTEEIADGVKVSLYQHSSDSDQYIGDKDLFKKLDEERWGLR